MAGMRMETLVTAAHQQSSASSGHRHRSLVHLVVDDTAALISQSHKAVRDMRTVPLQHAKSKWPMYHY